MSTQPKHVTLLNKERTAKLYQRRGIVRPQRLSDETIQQFTHRRAA